MSRRKCLRVFVGGIALLALFGCSLLLREEGPQAGWYIRLNVAAPAAARAIGVSEHEVTALILRVYGPGDQLLEEIDWHPVQGPRSYLVPVSQAGQHRLEVTHLGEDNGAVVQAVESALFTIQAMRITVIEVVPGAIGVIKVEPGEPAGELDLTGYWDVYMGVGGQEFGRNVMCILQTDSQLQLTHGFTGTISGWTFTMEGSWDGFPVGGTVTVSPPGNEIIVPVTGTPFGDVTMRMVRPCTAPFGRLDVEGSCEGVPVSVHTDFGLGSLHEPEDHNGFDSVHFHVWHVDHRLNVQLWFNLSGSEIPVGVELTTPHEVWMSLVWRDDEGPSLEYVPVESGTLTVARCDEDGIAGSFSMSFSGDDFVEGSFDVGWLHGAW